MPEIHEIKRRLSGLKSINNVTYAMQIVTISRLKRIREQLDKTRRTVDDIKRTLEYLLSEDKKFYKKVFSIESNKDLKPVLILFFSSRGFCGSFNQDLLNQTRQYFAQHNLDFDAFDKVIIGKKGPLMGKGIPGTHTYFAPEKDTFSAKDLIPIEQHIKVLMSQNREIHLAYFNFKTIVTQDLVVEQFYPLSEKEFSPNLDLRANRPFFVEPSVDITQEKTLGYYLNQKLLRALRNEAASEFGQRFLLMKSAVDNIKDLSGTLLVQMNKERQRMITQEISEIISAFNALQKR